jgi:hypothetical protein
MRIPRPSPAVFVAIVALVVASTGSAVGASLITGKQIRNGSITGADIRNHSITSADIRNHTIAGADIRSHTISRRNVKGSLGAPGATGPAGPPGPAGPRAQLLQARVKATLNIPSGQSNQAVVVCPAGMNVVGGGFQTNNTHGGLTLASDSFGSANTWTVQYDNTAGSDTAVVSAIAYCVGTG